MIRIETLDLICFLEGFVSYPYRDIAGVPTIGYGSCSYGNGRPVAMSDKPILESYAFKLMADNLEKHYLAALTEAVTVPLPSYFVQGALLSWCYNVGAGAMRGSSVIKFINARQFDKAREALGAWNKITNPKTGKKQVSPGLQRRRDIERGFWALDDSRPYTRNELQTIMRGF